MRDKIRAAALNVFDKQGFYRSGIRDIAALAECSLPTLYYYYKSKERLFEVVVCEAYQALVAQIADELPEGMPLKDICYFTVLQQAMLEGDDRRIMRLALKTMLGMDGNEEMQKKLKVWNEDRRKKEMDVIAHENLDSVFGRLVFRVTDHMLQQAVLDDLELTGEDIRRELDYLFKNV